MPISTSLTQCDKKGSEFSLYLNLTNDCTTRTWSFHIGVTGDLALNETEDQEELSVRDPAQLVKQYVESKIDLEISGTQVIDHLNTYCRFLNASRSGGLAIDVAILSGYIGDVGSAGWMGKFRNFDRSMTGPETGPGLQNFLLKPAACQIAACAVDNVEVAVADAIAAYDPNVFAAA